ncbi:hypothetical protein MARA_27240 [Mycolicibacterium arabiense]|uniref:Uncharacterized protein n=1 Tax=Mycolicibacterium arabiense TaxID=1286181 RepID=A0A7I7RZ55_9MYCO|nr:hypothetical protein MARA_27240 [Mycolicibacterium arabiense]
MAVQTRRYSSVPTPSTLRARVRNAPSSSNQPAAIPPDTMLNAGPSSLYPNRSSCDANTDATTTTVSDTLNHDA